eukprot:gene2277-1419_t
MACDLAFDRHVATVRHAIRTRFDEYADTIYIYMMITTAAKNARILLYCKKKKKKKIHHWDPYSLVIGWRWASHNNNNKNNKLCAIGSLFGFPPPSISTSCLLTGRCEVLTSSVCRRGTSNRVVVLLFPQKDTYILLVFLGGFFFSFFFSISLAVL